MIDVLADEGTGGVLREAYKLTEAEVPRVESGVYGLMKMDMMKVVLDGMNMDEG